MLTAKLSVICSNGVLLMHVKLMPTIGLVRFIFIVFLFLLGRVKWCDLFSKVANNNHSDDLMVQIQQCSVLLVYRPPVFLVSIA